MADVGFSTSWITPKGYRRGRIPGYPFPRQGKRWAIFEHVAVMELRLGRRLDPWEQVHHIDGDKLNNAPENLEVLEWGEHARQHAGMYRDPLPWEGPNDPDRPDPNDPPF